VTAALFSDSEHIQPGERRSKLEKFATERFAGLGLAEFIQKPYQLGTLIARIQVVLGGAEVPRS
jgi:hypothetical protein